jgi:hypothetical protein
MWLLVTNYDFRVFNYYRRIIEGGYAFSLIELVVHGTLEINLP